MMELREFRRKAKITQAKLAERSGVSQGYIAHIESGRRVPTVKTAKKIAEALGFDWTRFYEDEKDLFKRNA